MANHKQSRTTMDEIKAKAVAAESLEDLDGGVMNDRADGDRDAANDAADEPVENVTKLASAEELEARRQVIAQQEALKAARDMERRRQQALLDKQDRESRRATAEVEAQRMSEQLKKQEAALQDRQRQEREALQRVEEERQHRLERWRANGARQSGGMLIAFAVIGIVVSMVDITFLSDVLGRMLNMGQVEATILSAVIGLSAMIMLMGFQGYKEAHATEVDRNKPMYQKAEVVLWFCLGVFLMVLRIISGYILELSPDEAVLGGTHIRMSDLVTGPVMFILYLGAGLFAMYGIKNFFQTDTYAEMMDNHSRNRNMRTVAMERNRVAREQRNNERALVREHKLAEKQERQRVKALERQDRQRNRAIQREQKRLQKEYQEARRVYEAKVKAVHAEHERISDKLSQLEASRRDLGNVGGISDRLINNVAEVRSQVQGQVAMLVNSKSHISVDTLNGIIADYNQKHPF